MKQKSTNQILNSRTCVITRKKYSKEDLIRFDKKNDLYKIDLEMNGKGRGFYIHDDKIIIKKCISKNILANKYKIDKKENDKLNKDLLKYYEGKYGKE